MEASAGRLTPEDEELTVVVRVVANPATVDVGAGTSDAASTVLPCAAVERSNILWKDRGSDCVRSLFSTLEEPDNVLLNCVRRDEAEKLRDLIEAAMPVTKLPTEGVPDELPCDLSNLLRNPDCAAGRGRFCWFEDDALTPDASGRTARPPVGGLLLEPGTFDGAVGIFP